MEKYSTLATEIRSTYRVQTETIPIVIGALGTVPKGLPGFLKSLGISDVVGCMQTCALLGSQRILKNALSIWRVMSLFWQVCVFVPWVCSLFYVFCFLCFILSLVLSLLFFKSKNISKISKGTAFPPFQNKYMCFMCLIRKTVILSSLVGLTGYCFPSTWSPFPLLQVCPNV